MSQLIESDSVAAPVTETVDRPLLIKPSNGWVVIKLRDLWLYRDLLLSLAQRDIKVRYKQTALGIIWVVLQPLLAAGIFAVVFGGIAGLKSDGVPYFVFCFAGQLAWNLFGSTLTRVSSCLIGNAPMISKVFFPRLVLPLSTVGSVLVDFAVAAVMMAVLLAAHHIDPGWRLLLVPLWMALLLMLSLGVGLWAAALTVSYRDVQYIMPVIIQLVLYASPVAYAASAVPQRWKLLLYLNPLSGMLDGFRWSVLGSAAPSASAIAWSVTASVALFIAGASTFKQMERRFADVI
jgi:lipopolysaccharide transport system permease protein